MSKDKELTLQVITTLKQAQQQYFDSLKHDEVFIGTKINFDLLEVMLEKYDPKKN